jgi:hypothetical protein
MFPYTGGVIFHIVLVQKIEILEHDVLNDWIHFEKSGRPLKFTSLTVMRNVNNYYF